MKLMPMNMKSFGMTLLLSLWCVPPPCRRWISILAPLPAPCNTPHFDHLPFHSFSPQELQFQLQRLIRGDMTLVTALGAMREATAAAISQAFKSSDVIRMFAAREPAALREKLAALQEQQKLNKLSADAYQYVTLCSLRDRSRETLPRTCFLAGSQSWRFGDLICTEEARRDRMCATAGYGVLHWASFTVAPARPLSAAPS